MLRRRSVSRTLRAMTTFLGAVAALIADLHRSELPPDARIAEVAQRQAGRIHRFQLLALGVDEGQIAHRILVGRLHHVPGHPGVFAVGHAARTFDTAVWDAALLGGEEGRISATTATVIQGVEARRRGEPVHLIVPRGSLAGGRRGATQVHWTRNEDPLDVEVLPNGLRVSSLPMAFVELAGIGTDRRLRAALRQAERRGWLDRAAVLAACDRSRGRKGASALRRVLSDPLATRTRSGFEDEVVAFCRARGIRLPIVNAKFWVPGRLRPIEADFAWIDARYMIEADGPDHDTGLQREDDDERDLLLKAAGWKVDRLRRNHLRGRPDFVERMILGGLGEVAVPIAVPHR